MSLCAGDGAEVCGVLRYRDPPRPCTLLVETDEVLAGRARIAGDSVGGVEVRQQDAGEASSMADYVPAEVLLLSGVLGNLTTSDAHSLIFRLLHLLAEGGAVIWTRGRGDPDPRPAVRASFAEAGFDELAFVGHPEPYGVGWSVLRRHPRERMEIPDRLFTFAPCPSAPSGGATAPTRR